MDKESDFFQFWQGEIYQDKFAHARFKPADEQYIWMI